MAYRNILMSNKLIAALILMGVILLLTPLVVRKALSGSHDVNACGACCAQFVLSGFSRSVDDIDFQKHFPDIQKMYSFRDLEEFMSRYGLKTLSVSVARNKLFKMLDSGKVACIAQLQGSHFVSFKKSVGSDSYAYSDNGFNSTLNASSLASLLPEDNLKCLLVSDLFDFNSVIQLGSLYLSSTNNFSINIAYQGADAIQVKGVESTCGCIANVDSKSLPADSSGSSVKVRGILTANEHEGDFTKTVTIKLSKPFAISIVCTLSYRSVSPIAINPGVVVLAPVANSERSEYEGVFSVKNNTSGDVSVRFEILNNNQFLVQAKSSTIRRDEAISCTATLRRLIHKQYRYDTSLLVIASGQEYKVPISFQAKPERPLNYPNMVSFGVVSRKQLSDLKKRIAISCRPGSRISISSSSFPAWIVVTSEVSPTKITYVMESIDFTKIKSSNLSGIISLTLFYDGVKIEGIEIPLSGVLLD